MAVTSDVVISDILSGCRLFDTLPLPARRALAEASRRVEFRRGERLISMGQPTDRLLVITEGLAKLVGVSPDGIERILYLYRPGDVAGPTVLLINFEHDYEIVAMSPVRALAVSRRELLRIGRTQPSVILALAREVSRLLAAMTDRVLQATSNEVPVRLSRLLLEFAVRPREFGAELVPLSFPLTHEVMAQIVGASRPHTSTVLRDLESVGAVQRRSGRGLLVRTGRLKDVVEGNVALRNGGGAGASTAERIAVPA
ncbi:MAG TPA: Crp/Fnr family transcriptional regulator [Gemmatimonadota bacterium]|nr:Crp/Fnr family transcriptional regulator [Gemmatimonadota bacterium]